MTPKTLLAAVPEREATGDALLLAPALRNMTHKAEFLGADGEVDALALLKALPAGAKVGSSSARRVAQLKRIAPHLEPVNVRGNVQTRMRKLADPANGLSAIVLATAGLRRLALEHRIDAKLDKVMVHAVAQAALGLQTRDDDSATIELLRGAVDHARSHMRVAAERALAKRIGLGCSVPAAAAATFAAADSDQLTLVAEFYSPDGAECLRDEESGAVKSVDDACALGATLAERLLANGVEKILAKSAH